MAGKVEGVELVSSLRQLLRNQEHHIREMGSVEQAQDLLLHLEENDENFHR